MGRYGGGHLDDLVDDYVDGRLTECATRRAARHLLVCETCREAVDAERVIVNQVRAVRVDPGRHADLVAGLLALDAASTTGADPGGHEGSGCPGGAFRAPDDELRGPAVIRLAAPAQYARGVRRPALALAAVATVCGAILVTSVPHARPSAPVAPSVAQNTSRGDVFDAPSLTVTAAEPLVTGTSHAVVMRVKTATSGRMNP